MASVDDIFKAAGAGKHKIGAGSNPAEAYKSAKNRDDDVPTAREGGDDDIDMDGHDDDDGDDDNADADAEGRFFGSGVGATTQAAIDLLDRFDKTTTTTSGDNPEDVPDDSPHDAQWARRLATSLKKKIAKNSALRAKYPDEPTKFIESEADVDDELRHLSVLAESSHIYSDFVDAGGVAALTSLMAHENVDIVVRVVQVFTELTDDDVDAAPEAWDGLVDAAVDGDLIEALRDTLGRIDDVVESASEEDVQGVYTVMAMLEILSQRPALVTRIGITTGLVSWLVKRLKTPDRGNTLSDNRKFAAELVSILATADGGATVRSRLIDLGAVDVVLTILSRYRKTDPPPDHDEFVRNLFLVLNTLVGSVAGKAAFVASQGTALLLIILRQGNGTGLEVMKRSAIESLVHLLANAGTDPIGPTVADEVVTLGGLAVVFTTFIKSTQFLVRTSDAQQQQQQQQSSTIPLTSLSSRQKKGMATAEAAMSIMSSLLTLLPAESDTRLRLLAKFVEKEYAKLDRLMLVRSACLARLAATEAKIERERRRTNQSNGGGDDDDEEKAVLEMGWYQDRLAGGLHALRTIEQVIAWVGAEDDGAKEAIARHLHSAQGQGQGWKQVWDRLIEFRTDIGEPPARLEKSKTTTEPDVDERDRLIDEQTNQLAVLDSLIDVLDGW